jgi:hypothetical protein
MSEKGDRPEPIAEWRGDPVSYMIRQRRLTLAECEARGRYYAAFSAGVCVGRYASREDVERLAAANPTLTWRHIAHDPDGIRVIEPRDESEHR